MKGELKALRSNITVASSDEKSVSSLFARMRVAWNPWRIGPAILFAVLYLWLDRVTVFFQMWAGVSAWYPPVGLEAGAAHRLRNFLRSADVLRGHCRFDPQLPPVSSHSGVLGGKRRCRGWLFRHGRYLAAHSARRYAFPALERRIPIFVRRVGRGRLRGRGRRVYPHLGRLHPTLGLSKSRAELVHGRFRGAGVPNSVSSVPPHAVVA